MRQMLYVCASLCYIIHDCNTFLPIIYPDKNCRFVGETEEIGCKENEDKAAGKMGSVCNIRKPNTEAAHTPSEPIVIPSTESEVKSKQKQVKNQRTQLEDLLRFSFNEEDVQTMEGYEACRGQYATLRAFERKLLRLCGDALQKCRGNLEKIRGSGNHM